MAENTSTGARSNLVRIAFFSTHSRCCLCRLLSIINLRFLTICLILIVCLTFSRLIICCLRHRIITQKYLYAALLWTMRRPSAKKKLSDYVSKGASIISCYCSSLSSGSSYTYCHWFVDFGTQKGKLNSN